MNSFLINVDKPDNALLGVVFAHGSGIGMDHWFMNSISASLVDLGIAVARFQFPYRQLIRETGIKRPPNTMPVLIESFQSALNLARELHSEINWHLAGKSLGARVAVNLSANHEDLKVICLGYPFHPVGKPEKLRIDLLNSVHNSILILQGTRDPFGRYDEVQNYALNSNVIISWLEDGDHDFTTKKSSRVQFDEHCLEAAKTIKEFLLM